MVTRWELVEPTIHRTPLPTAIFRAMMTVALSWKWFRFSGVLCLAFLGIARPGEPLSACRSELVLPRDMMTDDNSVAYLKVLKPKTRHRGKGNIQHISVHETEFILFLDSVFGAVPKEDRLYACSPSAFRRRWDAILEALLIPKSSTLTPGGLRGGGCVHAFQKGCDLPKLLWRMRIKHLQTLESYLQDVAASTVISELPSAARERVRCAAAMTSSLLAAVPTNANPCPS